LLEERTRAFDAALGQHLFGLHQHAVVDSDRGLGPGDLYRRRFAEEIGKRVKQPDKQGRQYGKVFPEGVTVHRRSARKAGAGPGWPGAGPKRPQARGLGAWRGGITAT